jgi:hypothetical protein
VRNATVTMAFTTVNVVSIEIDNRHPDRANAPIAR